jgi:hypothetical protein
MTMRERNANRDFLPVPPSLRQREHPFCVGSGRRIWTRDQEAPEHDFTNRNTTFVTWNLLHMARLLRDAGGMPAHGNQRALWEAGCRFDFANPECR